MEIIKRCKACGAPLDNQGICSKPCKLGKLQKQIAELKAKIAKEKKSIELTHLKQTNFALN